MGGFDLETCARPNILRLQPYRCARDDYPDDGYNTLLDANENAYGPGLVIPQQTTPNGDAKINSDINITGLNRYPDPHQTELKERICHLRNSAGSSALRPEHVFVGVGSDEAIDSLIRTFCEPGKSSLLICPPTYGMYNVSASINDVAIVSVPLNADFTLDVPRVLERLGSDSSIKLMYICSPGNPTARTIPQSAIEQVLAHPTWNGVVVVDEAYIDFATRNEQTTSLPRSNSLWDPPSMAPLVPHYPNLVVMGTLSKAHGLAGLRLGFAICPAPIARLLNALKAPYNISSLTSQVAIRALQPASLTLAHENIKRIVEQRDRLMEELPHVPGIGRIIGGLDSNFLLVEILDQDNRPSNTHAFALYEKLAGTKGVVVRFRGKEIGCEGCLRITVGTGPEIDYFLTSIKAFLPDILAEKETSANRVQQDAGQEKRQAKESSVVT